MATPLLSCRSGLASWCKSDWQDDDLFKLTPPELDVLKLRVAVCIKARYKGNVNGDYGLEVGGTKLLDPEASEPQLRERSGKVKEGPFDSKLGILHRNKIRFLWFRGAAILAVSAVSLLHFVWVVSCSILLHICCSEQDAQAKYDEYEALVAAKPESDTFEQWEAKVENASCYSTVINCCLIEWSSRDGPWTELCARSLLGSLSQPSSSPMMSQVW